MRTVRWSCNCRTGIEAGESRENLPAGGRYLQLGPPAMPLFRTRSAAIFGIDAQPIDVEVDLYPSGSSRDFVTVGMPDTAVRESREQIKSALIKSGTALLTSAQGVHLLASTQSAMTLKFSRRVSSGRRAGINSA